MTSRKLVIIAILSALMSLVALGSWASAAAPSDAPTHKIAMTLLEGKITGTKVISARLTNGDQPLGNQPVDFFVTADFFGERQVKLDTVTTDATGTATITYQPRWDGIHIITARCHGDGNQPPVEVSQTIRFSGSAPAYVPKEVGLEPVRRWSPAALVIVVVAVWALLLFVAFRTLRGIARFRS